MKIFISYAREDQEIALRLAADLEARDFQCWLDKKELRPGANWKLEIGKAIRESSFFVALLSSWSLRKRGFVQQEIVIALEELRNVPPSDIYFIPVRIDECAPEHPAIEERQWVDLFPSYERGLADLVRLFAGGLPEPAKRFDVFLSHNGRDVPAVLELAEALRARGLDVWLAEWTQVPGRPWQEGLEEVIETSQSAAVLVGKDGIGPWEDAETRGCLAEFVHRKLPVIPVLLPGTPAEPRLPLFLAQMTWVDLRCGLSEEGLDRIQWGVTGKRPDRSTPLAAVAPAGPTSAEARTAPLGTDSSTVGQKQLLTLVHEPEVPPAFGRRSGSKGALAASLVVPLALVFSVAAVVGLPVDSAWSLPALLGAALAFSLAFRAGVNQANPDDTLDRLSTLTVGLMLLSAVGIGLIAWILGFVSYLSALELFLGDGLSVVLNYGGSAAYLVAPICGGAAGAIALGLSLVLAVPQLRTIRWWITPAILTVGVAPVLFAVGLAAFWSRDATDHDAWFTLRSRRALSGATLGIGLGLACSAVISKASSSAARGDKLASVIDLVGVEQIHEVRE